ncbi:MAG: phosphatase PAP2 family protein [Deltaproteobacteria bacterium]|jgi:hypothetical protein|nr:phosphatase PAP2 family protein [Deltaproteobacteria bacterium]
MAHTVTKIIKENVYIIGLVGVYIFSGYFIQHLYKIPNMMNLQFTQLILIQISVMFSACFLFVQILRGKTWEYFNIQSIAGFIIILLLLFVFKSAFASIKQAIPLINDFCWDRTFMKLDFSLHFNHHAWKVFQSFLNNEYILRKIDLFYMLWFFILLTFCLWMAWTSDRKLRLQFFISSLLVWIILGSIFGTIFSSAGPCYYSKVVEVSEALNPYQPMLNKLYTYHESQHLWAVFCQMGVWDAKISNKWLPFGGISAMPSIHVAMAIIFMLTGWRANKLYGIVLAFYALVIIIGSVVLAWHYAIDGYVSIVCTILIWNVSGKLVERQKKFDKK